MNYYSYFDSYSYSYLYFIFSVMDICNFGIVGIGFFIFVINIDWIMYRVM